MKSMLTMIMCTGLLVAVSGCPIPPKPDPKPERKLDSDGDGISDADEKENGSDPKDCADPFASGCDDPDPPEDETDSDGDGISDDDETRAGTNPFDCADPLPAGCTDKPDTNDLCAHVTDCNDGDLCTSDACVPGIGCVSTPITCPSGQECDPDTGSCVTLGCVSDADCGPSEVCNAGKCEPDDSLCQTDADCPSDGLFCNGAEICDEAAACVSGGDPCLADEFCNEASDTCDECLVDADCTDGDSCGNGVCELPEGRCEADTDCDAGEVCMMPTTRLPPTVRRVGWCEPAGQPCGTDADCDTGTVCNAGVCGPECHIDSECADMNSCSSDACVDKVCVHTPIICDELGNCTVCPPGGSCYSLPMDCAEGTEFNPDMCRCESPLPCLGDAHCDAGEVCNDGVCEPAEAECQTGAECDDEDSCTSDGCYEGVCVFTPIICDELGNCDVCPPGGFCYSMPVDCAGGLFRFSLETCGCEPIPPCTADADCADDIFCNGAETCESGTCFAGTPRCAGTLTCDEELQRCVSNLGNDCDDCNDGNSCTTDVCVNNRCVHTSITCDDGLYCNGAETCDPARGCTAGTDPCPGTACTESGGCAGPATLRVVNNTHYAMIDIQLNGQQMVNYPNGILPGGSFDFEFNGSGSVEYYFAVGYYDDYGNRAPWYSLQGSTTVTVGQTVQVVFDNPTIGQLLSGFDQSGRDWIGPYYCYNCQNLYNEAKFHFGYNGSWKFYDNGSFVGSGSVILTSWDDYAACVSFKLSAGDDEIQLCHPFSTFSYVNGPSDWPEIFYTAQ